MIKAKVIKPFASVKYSGICGTFIDIAEEEVAKDLLRAGYIEVAEERKKVEKPKKVKE